MRFVITSGVVTFWSEWFGFASGFVLPPVSVSPSLRLDAIAVHKLALDYTNAQTAGAAISSAVMATPHCT